MGRLTRTVSGEIASFKSADVMPMSMTVQINPAYGGCGDPYLPGTSKNKFDPVGMLYREGYGLDDDGTIVSAESYSVYKIILPEGAYIFSGTEANSSASKVFRAVTYNSNDTMIELFKLSYTSTGRKSQAFTVTAETAYVMFSIRYTVSDMQVESGSTATDYVPYSNIRPISGWTEMTCFRRNKNIMPSTFTTTNGKYISDTGEIRTTSGYCYINEYIPVRPNTKYTIQINRSSTGATGITVPFYDVNKQFLERATAYSAGSGSGVKSGQFTTSAETAYIRASFSPNYSDLQVELGNAATEYVAPEIDDKTIALPESAGTVYGGSLTVNEDGTGTLSVDRAYYEFDGSEDEDWEIYERTNNYAFIRVNETKIYENNKIISNIYPQGAVSSGSNTDVVSCIYGSSVKQSICIRPSWMDNNTTASEIKSFLASNNLQAVVTLIDPVEYSLTSAEVGKLTTLQGINNVWCDTGSISLTYNFCDHLYRKRQTLLNPHIETVSGDIATFKTNLAFPVKNLTVNIDPVQEGSGDPAPDNIRPITGWTGVTLYKTRDNLFGGDLLCEGVTSAISSAVIDTEAKTVRFASGATVTGGALTKGVFLSKKFKENTQYTFIFTIKKSSGSGSNMRVYYTDGTYSAIPSVTSALTKETKILVTPSNKTVSHLSKSNNSGTTHVYYDESGIFEGVLSADDFKAYEGQKISVSFPSEAGTVYGGTLTVNEDGTGTLSVDRAYYEFDGSEDEDWQIYTDADPHYAYFKVSNTKIYESGEIISNMYPQGAAASNTDVINIGYANATKNSIFIRPSWMDNNTTASDIKTYLASNNLQAVVTLIDHVEYSLTASQIKAILGQGNNIWADTGEISDLKYWKQ